MDNQILTNLQPIMTAVTVVVVFWNVIKTMLRGANVIGSLIMGLILISCVNDLNAVMKLGSTIFTFISNIIQPMA